MHYRRMHPQPMEWSIWGIPPVRLSWTNVAGGALWECAGCIYGAPIDMATSPEPWQDKDRDWYWRSAPPACVHPPGCTRCNWCGFVSV